MWVSATFGNFVIETYVADASGPISQIEQGVSDCRHFVSVHNFTSLTYDVEVQTKLPQGARSLEFVEGGKRTTEWTAEFTSLANSETENEDRSLECTQPGPSSERIHVVNVKYIKSGRHRWFKAAGKYPLALRIDII